MINNAPRPPLALLLVLAGCSHPDAVSGQLQGVVEYDERVVSFEVPGRVASVPIHAGDAVKVGDVLATLDDREEKLHRDAKSAEVAAAQADVTLLEAAAPREDVAALASQVTAAKATEGLLKKTVERTRALVERDALPQAELDRAEADLARTSSERASLQHKLAALMKGPRPEEIGRAEARTAALQTAVALEDDRLARYAARSLAAGTVIDVHAKVGELATTGTPVATLADVTHPYVDVFVPQGSLDGVRLGAKAEVRVDAPGAPLPGTVEWISPRTEFTPHFLFSERERPNLVVRVRVRIADDAARLHAGVPAFVKVVR
ncbi:MAG: HlyD family efflux transporter periplasmic adaptor subunit [Polyangiales bacterium]